MAAAFPTLSEGGKSLVVSLTSNLTVNRQFSSGNIATRPRFGETHLKILTIVYDQITNADRLLVEAWKENIRVNKTTFEVTNPADGTTWDVVLSQQIKWSVALNSSPLRFKIICKFIGTPS